MTTPNQPPLDAPDDQWLVYADALQEAGDPRGELIALNKKVADGDDPAARDAFVKDNAEALLGPGAPFVEAYAITWNQCLAENAEVRVGSQDDPAKVVEALLASPVAAGLHALSLVGAPSTNPVDLSAGVAALADKLPKTCTSVALVDDRAQSSVSLISRDYDPGTNLVGFGPLKELAAKVEQLQIVTADPYQLALEGIDAPKLRSFVLHGLRYAEAYDPPGDVSQVLAEAKWPQLEEFETRLCETWTCSVPDETGGYVTYYEDMEDEYDDYGDDDGFNEGVNYTDELRGLFENLKQTPLKRLALTSFDSAGSLLDALKNLGLPETLEELDLSESNLSSDNVQFFLDNKELFGKLQRLVLEDTLIDEEAAKPLAGLGPEISHSAGGGVSYRFLVGME